MNGFWDRLGISTSILCILHCLLTPFLVMLVPFVGHSLAHGWFHVVIASVVVPVAVWALWNGYRQHHIARVLWLGGTGLVFICAALVQGPERLPYEFGFMIVGGLLLASAHFINLRECQSAHH